MTRAAVDDVLPEQAGSTAGAGRGKSAALAFAVQVAAIALLLAAIVVGYARWRTGSLELVWPYLAGQRLLFEPTCIDLGTVPQGKIVEENVRVLNLSSGELRLIGSQRTCGCIAIEEFPVVIPAGAEHRVRLKIAMPRELGQFAHSIRFFSDDRGYSAVVIAITGKVQ